MKFGLKLQQNDADLFTETEYTVNTIEVLLQTYILRGDLKNAKRELERLQQW